MLMPLPSVVHHGLRCLARAVSLSKADMDMIKIHEPDVTLTDYALTIECAILVWLIGLSGVAGDPVRLWLALGLSSIGLAAATGGTVHGFFPAKTHRIHRLLWRLTLALIGITTLSMWALGFTLIFKATLAAALTRLAAALCGALIIYMLVHRKHFPNFKLAITYYMPAAIFLFTAYLINWRDSGNNLVLWGAGGMALTFIAGYVQQSKIRLNRYLDHNALYHIIQGAGLILLFIGTEPLFTAA